VRKTRTHADLTAMPRFGTSSQMNTVPLTRANRRAMHEDMPRHVQCKNNGTSRFALSRRADPGFALVDIGLGCLCLFIHLLVADKLLSTSRSADLQPSSSLAYYTESARQH
jgi:hypothetical protein